jgi:hypothetical protein
LMFYDCLWGFSLFYWREREKHNTTIHPCLLNWHSYTASHSMAWNPEKRYKDIFTIFIVLLFQNKQTN